MKFFLFSIVLVAMQLLLNNNSFTGKGEQASNTLSTIGNWLNKMCHSSVKGSRAPELTKSKFGECTLGSWPFSFFSIIVKYYLYGEKILS